MIDAPWIRDAPATWTRTYLGHLVEVRSGATPAKEESSYWDGNIPWVSPKDMKVFRIIDSEDHVSAKALQGTSLKIVPPGSVLLVIRGMILDHTVPVGVTARPVTINQDMKALLPREGIEGEYLAWLLTGLNPALLARVEEAAHGTKALRTEQWKKLPIAIPSRDEQRRIAAFLHTKTASIDGVIRKKTELVTLLQEERQALITQAVTKGLDPKTPMKDSGFAWIGEIPAYWSIARVKHVARLESGHTPSRSVPEHWLDSNDIPWVSLNDTKWLAEHDYISDTAYRINALGLQNSSARLLPAGIVVFTRDATIGKAAIATRPMAVSQHIIAWVCGPRIHPEYLLRVFYTMEPALERYTFGATIKTIGMDDVRELVTPVPPLDEQKQIVDVIVSRCQAIDATLAKLRLQLERLQEYRRSSIAATVTGKFAAVAEAVA